MSLGGSCYARLIRIRLGTPHHRPIDPEVAALRLGYRIVWASRSSMGSVRGMLIRREIHVARTGDPADERWTIAHELAHAEARLHGLDWRDERMVDDCAAALLEPCLRQRSPPFSISA